MNFKYLLFNTQKSKVLLGIFLLLLIGIIFSAYRYGNHPQTSSLPAKIEVDLFAPDALIVSQNLSSLPKELVGASFLEGLLDESLVFYYEEDEARRSLEGLFRRLAYEHSLDWDTRLIGKLIAEPAEVAWWRGAKGRPEHFVARLRRSELAKVAEMLLKIALDDKQLQTAATFDVDGQTATLLELRYGNNRSLGFVSLGDSGVVLSSPRLVQDESGNLTQEGLLLLHDLLKGKNPYLALPENKAARHSIVASAKMVMLGYDTFFPAVEALRFDFLEKENGWKASFRLSRKLAKKNVDFSPIWRAMPLDAAFCAAFPVDADALRTPLKNLLKEASDEKVWEGILALSPLVGGACWYSSSRLASPLFLLHAGEDFPVETKQMLEKLASTLWKNATVDDDGTSAMISTVHGIQKKGAENRAFEIALTQEGRFIVFSPDKAMLKASLHVLKKKAAALGDEAGFKAMPSPWLLVDPKQMGALVLSEVAAALPRENESLLREVAEKRLWPRLKAWGDAEPAKIFLPSTPDADGFAPLKTSPLKSASP